MSEWEKVLCVGLEFFKIHRYVIFLILPETCTPKKNEKREKKKKAYRKQREREIIL